MARNKHPEETRKKILEVAEKLFLEKGYDDTSIQDIIDGLGGMTKGVIYHHFKSKFDIFETLMNELSDQKIFHEWEGKTGLEKLQNSMRKDFTAYRKQSIAYSATVMIRTPRILGEQYLQTFSEIVPEIEKIVLEGIEDGSIQTEYPREIAELMMLTLNLWLGFQIGILPEEDIRRKILFIQKMFEGLGVPLLTDELVEETFKLFAYLKKE